MTESSGVIPPHGPWRDLDPRTPLEGYLSYYLSDDLSPVAVRAVTLVHNNKSDPNLETGTYGLFSTCAHGMRASIVARRYGVIFFVTRRNGERVLTGYYRLRWFALGTLNRTPPDYALAADRMRFVHPPITIGALSAKLAKTVGRPFRIYKYVDQETTAGLLRVFNRRKDKSADYLTEIDRLERFNRRQTGFRYVGWRQHEPFNWTAAREYLITTEGSTSSDARRALTTSPTNRWRCAVCGNIAINKALLKRCPDCKTMNALQPVS